LVCGARTRSLRFSGYLRGRRELVVWATVQVLELNGLLVRRSEETVCWSGMTLRLKESLLGLRMMVRWVSEDLV
jgi:hypothetical protein